MMRPSSAIILLPLLFAVAPAGSILPGATVAAWAGERGPVCREPSVIDEITREVRQQNYYSRLTSRLVTETPTGDPHVVRCQVCVQQAPYAMTQFGDRPVRQCVARNFAVRVLPNGFVVSDLP